ncbi:dTDP-4-dehydrorhamnose reductase [Acuticoccus mangrovi]|uniref:dTDP-4-dehydrorhamnose reductase n=1 Tax=Acuticoccus mangrovi TaxID=2796142 RepID=A0A934MFB5_9HYPH|nr:dTDP-4-dehydrorhamnose reductase [Acuticoccus mangrovi]MBJ3775288.1 dTDP-4-dehydrorhamnose reductase [Acuticoccus mangrovi]
MRCLVIGRSGQVATALVERAAAHTGPSAADVVALGRPDLDLCRPESIAAAISRVEPDVVVNAAAYTAVDQAESEPEAAAALNAAGPAALAGLCAAADIPLVHLSTDYVFDGTLDRPYREDDPIAPASVYGRTKAEGEAAVMAAGGRALVLRTAWVYSPFGKNFVKTMLRLGAERDRLRVVSDQVGNPTSALDIADAVLRLAAMRDGWGSGGEILHLAGTGETSWHGLAEAIFAGTAAPPVVEPIPTSAYPTPARRPANSRLDTTRLAERYGIVLPPWRESLAVTLDRLAGAAPR